MKLFKNKKGVSKLFEMILITPFAVYIVMLMLFQILGIVAQNGLASFTSTITRNSMTASSFDDALNILAQEAYYQEQYLIKDITIIDEGNVETTASFGVNLYSSGTFRSYIETDSEGNIKFNVTKYARESTTYVTMKNAWEIGSLVQIKTYDDLSTNLYSSLTEFTVYSYHGEKMTFSLGLTNVIESTNVQPISNDSKG